MGRASWISAAGAAVLGAMVSPPARAADNGTFNDCLARVNADIKPPYDVTTRDCFALLIATPFVPKGDSEAQSSAAADLAPRTATYILSNLGADVRGNEPTYGGRMQKTVWGHFDPVKPARVTFHTFGADIDTVLAVYGVDVKKSGKVSYEFLRGNDDTPVPGVDRGWSLVTVDVEKNEHYQIQIGGQDGAQTDRIALTATAFGPDGGVSAFLLSTTAGATMQNRDYVCEQRPCPSATFILHNSAKSAVKVTPSTTLPRFFSDPQPVTIAPGALAVVTFPGRDFTNTAGVAESGAFTFASIASGKAVDSIEKRASVFLADPDGAPEGLAMSAEDRFRAGDLNEPLSFDVKVRNTGSDEARGCGFRTFQSNFRNVLTRFRKVDAKSGKPAGDWGEAADVPAGAVQGLEVEVASMAPRLGDPAFGLANELEMRCVNRQPPERDLLNTLDVNVDGSGRYTEIAAEIAGGDKLAVPSGGQASFDVSTVNTLRAAEISARPVYVYPFDASDPNQRYEMSICRLDKRDKCLGPKDFTAPWAAKKGAKARFRVFVKAPKEKPPSDPGKFRIYLRLEGVDRRWPFLFGAESVAVSVK